MMGNIFSSFTRPAVLKPAGELSLVESVLKANQRSKRIPLDFSVD